MAQPGSDTPFNKNDYTNAPPPSYTPQPDQPMGGGPPPGYGGNSPYGPPNNNPAGAYTVYPPNNYAPYGPNTIVIENGKRCERCGWGSYEVVSAAYGIFCVMMFFSFGIIGLCIAFCLFPKPSKCTNPHCGYVTNTKAYAFASLGLLVWVIVYVCIIVLVVVPRVDGTYIVY